MSIKISGNGVGENKVVFLRLLAKWNELFSRKSLFDEMETVETSQDGTVTFTNEEAELSFYENESDNASRNDSFIVRQSLENVFDFLSGALSQKERRNQRTAAIIFDVVYEINAEKRISFVFSKYTDSNEVILHIEFSDDETDTDLKACVTAISDDSSLVSLETLLFELGKDEIVDSIASFKSQVLERKEEMEKAMKQEAEEKRNEELRPAFDALDNL